MFWCRFMEITLLVGLISNPIFNQMIIWLPEGNEISLLGGYVYSHQCELFLGCHQEKVSVVISTLLKDVVVSIMLWQFYKIFRAIRSGDIFNNLQITRIATAGWCFIYLSIHSLIKDFYFISLQSTSNELNILFHGDSFIYIPFGVGVVILSHVLKLATEIKEEQDLVI